MIWGEKYVNFHKLLKFFRCADAAKVFGCIKKDFLDEAADYDLSGMEGELSDVSDLAKMYFVKSTYANWDHIGMWDM